jgi:hypothetical protein
VTNYQQIVESAGAEYLRTTGDGTIIFRSGAGVELRIFDCACTPENVRLRLDMVKKFPAGRRDELADSIRITRSQISDLWHQLGCARRDACERDQGSTPPDIAELRRSRAALYAVQILNQLDDLKKDLKDRETEWAKLAPSFREVHEVELQLKEAERDLKYFNEIITDVTRQRDLLLSTSVIAESIR